MLFSTVLPENKPTQTLWWTDSLEHFIPFFLDFSFCITNYKLSQLVLSFLTPVF